METNTMQYYFMTCDGAFVSNDKYRTRWGDSCLIAFPDGKTMLIDTGVKGFYPILKKTLKKLQVQTIDYMVFTHNHSDHVGGAYSTLFTDFKIGHAYYNGTKNPGWEEEEQIATLCEKNNIPLTAWKAGDTAQFGTLENPITMNVLWPTEEAVAQLSDINTVAALNNLSLVMRFEYGEHSSLFTGDIYQCRNSKNLKYQVDGFDGTEELLVNGWQKDFLDADLLKLPHHGNPQTSCSMPFLNAVSPEYAVATSFEAVGVYLSFYELRGMTCPVYFDRMNGKIHVQAGIDGTMDITLGRTDYLEEFGPNWAESEKKKKEA
jgi:competence protein ComEC